VANLNTLTGLANVYTETTAGATISSAINGAGVTNVEVTGTVNFSGSLVFNNPDLVLTASTTQALHGTSTSSTGGIFQFKAFQEISGFDMDTSSSLPDYLQSDANIAYVPFVFTTDADFTGITNPIIHDCEMTGFITFGSGAYEVNEAARFEPKYNGLTLKDIVIHNGITGAMDEVTFDNVSGPVGDGYLITADDNTGDGGWTFSGSGNTIKNCNIKIAAGTRATSAAYVFKFNNCRGRYATSSKNNRVYNVPR
jgi:hypothetical protein